MVASRKICYHLYFVETPSPEENCFVVSQSSSSAAKFEKDGTGFDKGECVARFVRDVSTKWVEEYLSKFTKNLPSQKTFYVVDEALDDLGITMKIKEGNYFFYYGDDTFYRTGDFNYIKIIIEAKNGKVFPVLIKSVADLLNLVARDTPGEWVFRGQASCLWPLYAGIFRNRKRMDEPTVLSTEKRILSEFRRRARAFLPAPPTSIWEWLIIAQHYGLPTRLLDWTENPLVGLFFAVDQGNEHQNDGILYAYRHGSPDLDIDDFKDPFAVKKIELVRPAHLDQRVITHRSILTVEPYRILLSSLDQSALVHWNVPASSRATIKRELENLGVSQNTLFPGLESISKHIINKLWDLKH